MFKLILSLILLSAGAAFAGEPMGDYSFVCTAHNKTSELKIDGGVDPSGEFYIYFRTKGDWQSLNGENYMARRISTKNFVKFVSVTDGTLKTTLTISGNA